MWNILWTVISKPWPRFIRLVDNGFIRISNINFQLLLRMLSSFKAVIKSYEHFHFSTLESKSATIWRCAGDFFQGSAEIQNGRHRSTSVFLWTQKLKKLKSEIIQISQSHSPRYGDVQVIFLGFNRNSKWPPWINIFLWLQNLKN